MSAPLVSRRALVGAAGMSALAIGAATDVSAAQAGGSTLPVGQAERMALLRRLVGGDADQLRYGWLDGTVIAAGLCGRMTTLCRHRGLIVSRLERQDDGWRVLRAEIGVACDPVSGQPVARIDHPMGGEPIAAEPVILTTIEAIADDPASRWTLDGGTIVVEDQRDLILRNGVPAGSELRTRRIAGATFDATLVRTTSWPGWSPMAVTPGQCLYRLRTTEGAVQPHDLPCELRTAIDIRDVARLVA